MEPRTLRRDHGLMTSVLQYTAWRNEPHAKSHPRATLSASMDTGKTTAVSVAHPIPADSITGASPLTSGSAVWRTVHTVSVGCQCGQSAWQQSDAGGTNPTAIFVTEDMLRSSYHTKDEALDQYIQRRKEQMDHDADALQRAHDAAIASLTEKLHAAEAAAKEAMERLQVERDAAAVQKRRLHDEKQAIADSHRSLELRLEDVSHQLAHARRQQQAHEATIRKLEDNVNAAVMKSMQGQYMGIRHGSPQSQATSRSQFASPIQALGSSNTERLLELQRQREELMRATAGLNLDSPGGAGASPVESRGEASSPVGSAKAAPLQAPSSSSHGSPRPNRGSARAPVSFKAVATVARIAVRGQEQRRRESTASASSVFSASTDTVNSGGDALDGSDSHNSSSGNASPAAPQSPARNSSSPKQQVNGSGIQQLPSNIASRRSTQFLPQQRRDSSRRATVTPMSTSSMMLRRGGPPAVPSSARRSTIAVSPRTPHRARRTSSVTFGAVEQSLNYVDSMGTDGKPLERKGSLTSRSTPAAEAKSFEQRQLDIMTATVAQLPPDDLVTLLAQQQLNAQQRLLTLADRLQTTISDFERRSGPSQLATVEGQVSAAMAEVRDLYETQLQHIKATAMEREETLNRRWSASVKHAESQVIEKAKTIGELHDRMIAAESKVAAAEEERDKAKTECASLVNHVKQLHRSLLLPDDPTETKGSSGRGDGVGEEAFSSRDSKLCALCHERIVRDEVALQFKYRNVVQPPHTSVGGVWNVDTATGRLAFDVPTQHRQVSNSDVGGGAAVRRPTTANRFSGAAIAPCRDHLMYDARRAAAGMAPYPLNHVSQAIKEIPVPSPQASSTSALPSTTTLRPTSSWAGLHSVPLEGLGSALQGVAMTKTPRPPSARTRAV